MDENIIPECYVDTNLIETLAPPVNHYNHQKGCGTVANVMKGHFSDRFALGIIDKDKKQIDYLKEFSEICKTDSLILHKHPNKPHYIIQVFPAIERFILRCAVESGISLEDYGLSSDIEKLKKRSKTVTSKNDNDFKRMFKALKREGVNDLDVLSAWISYLKSHPYDACAAKLNELGQSGGSAI